MPETQAPFESGAGPDDAGRGAASARGGRQRQHGASANGAGGGRCVANPLAIDQPLNALFDAAGFRAWPNDDAVRLALLRVARRAVMAQARSFRRAKRAREGDGPHVAERLEEGVEVWRFDCLTEEVCTSASEAAVAALAVRGVADGVESADGGASPALQLARDTLRKLERLTLASIVERAERLKGLRWKEALRERSDEELAKPERLVASGGRVWERIVTLSGMRAVGERFDNCLARSRHAKRYQRAMLDGSLRLYVLRDARANGREHALIGWDAEGRTIEDLEAPGGEDVPARFREDVRQIVLRRRLVPDERLHALGLVPGTIKCDPDPWMEGTVTLPAPDDGRGKAGVKEAKGSARRAYRVWSFKGRVLVEIGRHEPLYVLFEARGGEPLAGRGLDDLGDATDAWDDDALEAARLALLDAARHAPSLPATVARLMVLIAHEGIENERRRREREERRTARMPTRTQRRVRIA